MSWFCSSTCNIQWSGESLSSSEHDTGQPDCVYYEQFEIKLDLPPSHKAGGIQLLVQNTRSVQRYLDLLTKKVTDIS